MRRMAPLLSLAMFVFSSALADEHPYIGLGGSVNLPTGDFGGDDISRQECGAKTGFGGGIEAGLAGNIADFYVRYSSAKHDAAAAYENIHAEGTWTVTQLVFGSRVHFSRARYSWIVPMIGIALANNRATVNGTVRESTLIREEATSQAAMAFVLETGAVLRLSAKSDLLMALQYHDFKAQMDSQRYLWSGSLDISYLAIQLGLSFKPFQRPSELKH